MGIIAWIILGLVVGIIAKFIMPGKDPGGFLPRNGMPSNCFVQLNRNLISTCEKQDYILQPNATQAQPKNKQL